MLSLFRRRRNDLSAPATALYAQLVAQARMPAFFSDLGVPDTVPGRFEMIALHAFLLFRRLRDAGPAGRDLAQATHDLMFADMDRSLREMGIGDMGIGKRVKLLARNLYGRISAYETGLAGDPSALAEALERNVYATAETTSAGNAASLAAYLRREDAALTRQPDDELLAGRVAFGPVIADEAVQTMAGGAT